MSRPQSNPVRYGALLTVEALLLAVGIHGGLFFCFSYEAPEPAAVVRSSGALSFLKTPPGAKGTAFCRWLEYHDPAGVVRSGSPSGYQACLPQEAVRQPPAPVLQSAPEVSVPAIPAVEKIAVPSATPSGYLPQAAAAGETMKCPFFWFDGGRMVHWEIRSSDAVALGRLPDAPTRIVLEAPPEGGAMRRFSIQESSGNRNADLLALKQVLSCAAPQERGCTVFWKSIKGGGK